MAGALHAARRHHRHRHSHAQSASTDSSDKPRHDTTPSVAAARRTVSVCLSKNEQSRRGTAGGRVPLVQNMQTTTVVHYEVAYSYHAPCTSSCSALGPAGVLPPCARVCRAMPCHVVPCIWAQKQSLICLLVVLRHLRRPRPIAHPTRVVGQRFSCS